MVRAKKWPSKEVAAARDHRRPAQAPAGALLPEVSRAYLRAYRVMELHEYLGSFAAQLIDELRPILEIKGVTANTDLLGKYTEAAVRNLVRRIVYPMRLSTGAVLDYPMPIPLRQIDIIVWAPFPAPAPQAGRPRSAGGSPKADHYRLMGFLGRWARPHESQVRPPATTSRSFPLATGRSSRYGKDRGRGWSRRPRPCPPRSLGQAA